MNKAKIYPWIFAVVFVLIIVILSGVASAEEGNEMLWSHELDGDVTYVSISPNGNYIAAMTKRYTGYIYLFDNEGKMLWSYYYCRDIESPYGVAVSPDGYVAAVVAHSSSNWDYVSSYIYFF
ncbi:MAG: hypothetical protein J7J44_06950 [Deltaproteobacteria bacterium]|nr:hypothetical protein [Deltaproteobacteria bacterium]